MDISLGPADRPPGAGALPREGDLGTVGELFRNHHLELVRLALVMTGDLATAEDVVQDCFERLHGSWRRIREPGQALAYARAAVLNGCRSAHRRSAVARKYAPRLAPPPGADVPDTAALAADRGQLVTALRQLPRRQREVLVLRYYEDLSAAEIAATLQISAGNVRAALSRGLAALAAIVGEGEQ